MTIETHEIEWRGLRIEVRFNPNWSRAHEEIYGYALAHLELRTIELRGFPLPVTETGYRSQFTPAHLIEREGGPVSFALGWLEAEAFYRPREWDERRMKVAQLSLFD
ncbi:MAG: hypothetical protein EOM26_13700 [Alphaproteobacteria bacterium]|nr:hypothetical protein [Alphaproteobacteria bacterium]